jgi:DNA end-binding protein Ku
MRKHAFPATPVWPVALPATGGTPPRLTPLGDSPPGLLETRFPRGILAFSAVAFPEYPMAPRANWKGFLRLSLVTCPVALYPATSDTEKVSFNQINRKTGHRIKYAKVDADTGEEVASEDIMKGYKIDTDTYIEVSKEELDDIALESTHTIEIDEFVPKSDIDGRYLIRPYYLVPDGKVGHDAFAVIRETVRSMNKVAIGRVVLTNREHIIALEPLGKGLMGTLLRYPYEVRSEKEYFDDIQDVKVTKDMLDLARHIVEKKSGSFEPERFEDHYESALTELIDRKRSGIRTTAKAAPKTGGNVINLMDALKRSLANERQSPPPPRQRAKNRARPSPANARCCCRSAASALQRKKQKRQRPRKLKSRYARPLDRKRPGSAATSATNSPRRIWC